MTTSYEALANENDILQVDFGKPSRAPNAQFEARVQVGNRVIVRWSGESADAGLRAIIEALQGILSQGQNS